MTNLYGKTFSKEELLKRVGDISQVGGVKFYELKEGNEKGVEALDFRTGTGFNFTVLLSRGMDISYAEYKGIPLCWRSSTGDISPSYFEPEGLGWLRSFYGGLVTTCGLAYLGAPSEDEGRELGLHGRVSHIPAKNVQFEEEWEKDEYIIQAKGKVRETSVFGEDLCLRREISTKLGESCLHIYDTVENLGYHQTEHMLLYHINIGFPIVDEDSELISPTLEVEPRDEEAEKGKEEYNKFSSPIPGFKEKVYYHKMKADKEGNVLVALVNKKRGLGIYLKYPAKELPNFVEWKMMGEGIYVVGMEPANCLVEGRAEERARGTLQFLKPQEKREYHLEIGLLSTIKEIRRIENNIKSLISNK